MCQVTVPFVIFNTRIYHLLLAESGKEVCSKRILIVRKKSIFSAEGFNTCLEFRNGRVVLFSFQGGRIPSPVTRQDLGKGDCTIRRQIVSNL